MLSGKVHHSLRLKIIIRVLIGLLVIMSSFFLLQYYIYKRDLIKNLRDSSTHYLSDIIKGSLKHAMITRSLDETRYIIDTVKKQRGVENIYLVDKRGEIKISPDLTDVGKSLDLKDSTCQICHRYEPENRNKTIMYYNTAGRKIFRNVNPIFNEPECYDCHNPETKINGVLITDFSLSEIEGQLSSKFKEMIFSLIFMIITTGTTIGVMMNRLVISKLENFAKVTKLFSKGDYTQRLPLEGEDEMADLAKSFNEMGENIQRSQEVREKKELLENVLNSVQESITIFDPEGKVMFFSRGAENMMEFPAKNVLGKDYSLLGPHRNRIWEIIQKEGAFQSEVTLVNKSGKSIPAFLSVNHIKDESDRILVYVEVVRNLTEEKTKEWLQKQLIHSERLAATGQLAAGVAHELNNPLGNILLYSKLLMEELNPKDIHYRNVSKIVDNVIRSKKIVSNLLDYTRSSEVNMEPNNINEIAASATRMLAHEMRMNGIESSLRLNPALPEVICDKNQIQQVFFNLIQNAIQAIQGAGRIEIETGLHGQEAIVFSVKDDGPGIPEESLAKVFEPFYTTKENGTGLGLSICYGIIQRHGGRISAESGQKNGQKHLSVSERDGTVLRVVLPVNGPKGEIKD